MCRPKGDIIFGVHLKSNLKLQILHSYENEYLVKVIITNKAGNTKNSEYLNNIIIN